MKFTQHLIVAGLVLSAASFVACGDDDDPPPPTADVTFYHAVASQGTLELTVGTEELTVDPQQLTTPVLKLDPGSYTLEMRAVGATQPLHTESLGNLTEGPHAFIITETDDYHVFEAGINRPIEQDGLYTYQVINLSSRTRDVYADGNTEPDTIGPLISSNFIQVTAADLPLIIDIYDEGADPQSATPKRFTVSEATQLTAPLTLLLLSFDDQNAEWSITPVEL